MITFLKNGELGRVNVSAGGFIDRIEIKFPKELTQGDGAVNELVVFSYVIPEELQKEKVNFTVPLDMNKDEYEVIVTTYKDGAPIKSVKLYFKVAGEITEELKTTIN